ncbi:MULTISPECIES: hypothetical protein [unclassified Streptomyces]|uniref:hypothetical protein n=1 Tax=Streptomyces sp. NPDC127129 TaxID=3345373 RepID=UPI003628148A
MTAEEEPQRSRAAGGCVLVALAGVPLAVAYAASTEAGILTTVGAATGAVWWSVRRTPKIHNPSPPPPSPPSEDTKPQFTSVPDPDNPHRTHIVWHTEEVA